MKRCYCGCTQMLGPKHAQTCAECGQIPPAGPDRYLFVSRHAPTPEQIALAEAENIELFPVGDLDAFAPNLDDQLMALDAEHNATGIVCFHPLIALTASNLSFPVGIFRNATRPGVDGKPQFFADLLVIWA